MKRTSLPAAQRSLFDPPRMSWALLPAHSRAEAIEHVALLLAHKVHTLPSPEELQEHERQD